MNDKKHLNLFFPQWQGSGKSDEILTGALKLREKYLQGEDYLEIPVSNEQNDSFGHGILGYDVIFRQLKAARAALEGEQPNTIFTVGGGCDVELLPVSWLNQLLGGDLTVLWLDAHGDLNTPASSPSKTLHGMPLRLLLGEGEKGLGKLLFSTLGPEQVILLGTRGLDRPESEYIEEKQIRVLAPHESDLPMDQILEIISAKGSDNIYLHIDLDVLDAEEFRGVMCPAPGGISMETLEDLLDRISGRFRVAGMSVLEATGREDPELDRLEKLFTLGKTLAHGKRSN